MAMSGDMRVSMRAFQFPSRLWREYDRFADGCQHFFSIARKKVLCGEEPKRKTALIGKKESSELANPHSYWVFDLGGNKR